MCLCRTELVPGTYHIVVTAYTPTATYDVVAVASFAVSSKSVEAWNCHVMLSHLAVSQHLPQPPTLL